MDLDRKKRLLQLLDRALERDPGERAGFLDEACGDDQALRDEMESLIATAGGSEFLEQPLFDVHAEDAGVGRSIGGYRLVRLLGRGGMGTVYLAEREDFEQRVALKLIRRGLDVDEMFVRRFENERQILARLEHTNIARLLDGGTTEDRLPYFVMEYVDGEPFDRYCKTHELSIGQRLELFRKVCSAVQLAHQNLVIHRDLKPGNILITEDGEPKLLDFGIAKLLDEDRTGKDLTALAGRGPMTPRYASPEQIRLEPITTASDVYSLGVLLYELLTGLDPYHLDTDRSDLVAQAILEREPDRPSTAVRRRAAEHEAYVAPLEPRKLQRRLSGDLDSIVLKAMRKEPRQRYPSVEMLSRDIRHHLTGLPVAARAGTVTYRASKFVRRHRLAMGVVATLLLLTLAVGLLWRQAILESDRAENERRGAQKMLSFLENTFKDADPNRAKGTNLTAIEVLFSGRRRLLEDLEGQPELQIDLADTLGRVLRNLGAYQNARELMEMSLRIARELYGDDHPEIAKRLANLGAVLNDLKDHSGAESCFREALSIRQEYGQAGSNLHKAKNNLATTLALQNEFEEAENLYLQVLKSRIEINKKDNEEVTAGNIAASHRNLAALYFAWGRLEEADDYIQKALQIRLDAHGQEHTDVASTRDLWADILAAQGLREEAREQFTETLRIRRKLLGKDHQDLARTRTDYAAFLAREDPRRAFDSIEEALASFRRKQIQTWVVSDARSVLGEVLVELGRYDEAAAELLAGHEGLVTARGATNFRTVLALERIIRLYEKWDKPDEIPHYRALLEAAGPASDRRLPSTTGDE